MNLNAKELINQVLMVLIMNFGALMMMADTEQRMDVFSVKKLLTPEESKTLNASMVMITNLLNLEFTALVLKLITSAI